MSDVYVELLENGDVQSLITVLLESDSFDLRHSAAISLGELGDSAAIGPLIAALDYLSSEDHQFECDFDGQIRLDPYTSALVEIGPDAVVPLVDALEDEQESIRTCAAEALGYIGDPAAVNPLIEAINDRFAGANSSIFIALGKLKDRVAVGPLIEGLEDENVRMRWAAAMALGSIGDATAIKPLVRALKSEDAEDPRMAMQEALDTLRPGG